MKRIARAGVLIAATVLFITGCSGGSTPTNPTLSEPAANAPASEAPLRVVASFTILTDMVEAIGGDLVDVHNLVPTGTDPHEYEPLPEDLKAVADADLLVMNGLNLEGGEQGWFARMVEVAAQNDPHLIEATTGVTPLTVGEGPREEIDPHAFTDPNAGVLMAREIRDGLQSADPEHADEYREQGDAYIAELQAVAEQYEEALAAIPEGRRNLVTSERAFQYLAASYDLREFYIWDIDTGETGSAVQLTELVDALSELTRDGTISYLITESNKDPRPMGMVSAETGIPIFPKPIYSDEIGATDGAAAGTYLGYLTHNLDVIVEALR